MIIGIDEQYWAKIKSIYIEGIKTKNATFEVVENVNSYENWISGKIKESIGVYIDNDEVIGWSSLSPISKRDVYSGVTEVTVYVDSEHHGKGVGSVLLEHLISFADNNNIWTLQCGIFLENIPSINLHLKKGFRKIGIRTKIGKMDNVWRDVVFLERRSKMIV